jgi:hypothetical protein
MGPTSIELSPSVSVSAHSNDFESANKHDDAVEAPAFDPDRTPDPDPALTEALITPSPLQIDPDLLPVAPALILNALALTPVERSGGRSPAIRQRSSVWIQNENAFPVDGFVPFDPKFSFSTSKFPKPVWPKTPPTIPTSFFKDHRSKNKVGGGFFFRFGVVPFREAAHPQKF